MNKKIFIIGVIAVCVSIIAGAMIMKPQEPPKQRYTVVTSDVNLILIDNETGKIYRKYMSTTEAPTDWAELEMPEVSK